MTRKSTPDILGELMGETIKQVDQKLEKQANQETREKVTFMLSKLILNKLEDHWIEIRRRRGDKEITKQLIVERAIQEYLVNHKTSK